MTKVVVGQAYEQGKACYIRKNRTLSSYTTMNGAVSYNFSLYFSIVF